MQYRSLHLAPPEWASTQLNKTFPLLCAFYTMRNRDIQSLHIHDVLELGICFSGKGIFVIEEKVFSFQEGDVFVINHLEMHRACVPDGHDSSWAFVMTDPSELLAGRLKDYSILKTDHLSGNGFSNRFPGKDYPKLNRILSDITSECKNKPPFHEDRTCGLLIDFLVEISRLSPPPAGKPPLARDAALMQKLKPALERITRDFGEALSMVSLAQTCGLSVGHFRRLFTGAFGKGPKEYLNDYRIAMAGNLLRSTGRKVVEIAMDCGFPTLSCFNRQFRAKTGCSPRFFREEGRSP